MQFAPKTEEQVSNCWPAGEYDYEVVAAEEKNSSKGNPMIELKLRVFHSDGRKNMVRDYLMEAMAYKLRHFAYSCGLGHAYENGTLTDESCVGKGGRVILKVESSEDYPDKNVVKDYVVADTTKEGPGYMKAKASHAAAAKPKAKSQPAAVNSGPVNEEDIPF